jgi:predicted RNA-binding protein Jag
MVHGQTITAAITGHTSLQSANRQALEAIAARYPYFGIPQLLLAKKLMNSGDEPAYKKQVQLAALHIPNLHWLHYQLQEQEETPTIAQPVTTAAIAVEEEKADTEKPLSSREVIDKAIEDLLHIPPKEEPVAEEDRVKESNDFPELVHEEEHTAPDDEIPNMRMAELLQQQKEQFTQPVDSGAELSIEPAAAHAVDYFGSQGIKIEDAQDKMVVKVRKFTDWLKHTKRANPYPTDLGTDPDLESAVQQTAASSNELKDVLTESMAEILAQQGKIDKAIQTYIKLSFLNPDKTAYFASKIQALKAN